MCSGGLTLPACHRTSLVRAVASAAVADAKIKLSRITSLLIVTFACSSVDHGSEPASVDPQQPTAPQITPPREPHWLQLSSNRNPEIGWVRSQRTAEGDWPRRELRAEKGPSGVSSLQGWSSIDTDERMPLLVARS